MTNIIALTKEEREVLHTLLLDVKVSELNRLGIDKEVYYKMGGKSVVLANTYEWPVG